jgi:DNA repair exonuclease SbcCD ATPase subunit
MKNIIIKRMTFVNFKGLRSLQVDFAPKQTDIYAENGLGKSSIFDGFTWVLFGKDSNGREKFGIKTRTQPSHRKITT